MPLRRSFPLALLALVCSTAVAQQPPGFGEEPVQSIFNEEVRCFRFRVEGEVVTPEYTRAFHVRYQQDDHPPILGAFPDREEDVIRVVGPPEAESAIRMTLARWKFELSGVPTDSSAGSALELQRRELAAQRRSLIVDIGSVELARVEYDETDEKQRSQIDQLDERIAALEVELAVVERKLAVIARTHARLEAAEAE